MIVKVKHQNNFVTLSNEPLKRKDLSYAAKGLLAYLMSLPEDWEVSLKHLSTVSTEGLQATRACLNELIAKGYIKRIEQRKAQGKFAYDYQVTDVCEIIEKETKEEQPLPEAPITAPTPQYPLTTFHLTLEEFTAMVQHLFPEADASYYHQKIGAYAKSKNLKKNWENYIILWLESDKEKGKLKTPRKAKNDALPADIPEPPEQSMIRSVLEKIRFHTTYHTTYTKEMWQNQIEVLRQAWQVAQTQEAKDLITQMAQQIETYQQQAPTEEEFKKTTPHKRKKA